MPAIVKLNVVMTKPTERFLRQENAFELSLTLHIHTERI